MLLLEDYIDICRTLSLDSKTWGNNCKKKIHESKQKVFQFSLLTENTNILCENNKINYFHYEVFF